MIMVLFSSLRELSSSFLCFLLEDRKPSKTNLSVGNPETTRAVILAVGPGRAMTSIPSSMASLIKSSPGSEILAYLRLIPGQCFLQPSVYLSILALLLTLCS